MKKSTLLLALLACLTASSQTLSDRVVPRLQPRLAVAAPRETNAFSAELETLLMKLGNLLQQNSTNRPYTYGGPEFMSIGPAAGSAEITPAENETELVGPAANLAENLGTVMGENLGISLGQSCAVPTSRQVTAPTRGTVSSVGDGVEVVAMEHQRPGAGFVKLSPEAFAELNSFRHALLALLTVQKELQRTLPTLAKLNAALEKEPASLLTTIPGKPIPSAWISSDLAAAIR